LSGEHVERRLAAILAADIAGYSLLMGRDEEGTLSQLKAFRKTLIDPTIAAHRGRIVRRRATACWLSSPVRWMRRGAQRRYSAAWPLKTWTCRRMTSSSTTMTCGLLAQAIGPGALRRRQRGLRLMQRDDRCGIGIGSHCTAPTVRWLGCGVVFGHDAVSGG
jgi:class 3 adenylate cyclase